MTQMSYSSNYQHFMEPLELWASQTNRSRSTDISLNASKVVVQRQENINKITRICISKLTSIQLTMYLMQNADKFDLCV